MVAQSHASDAIAARLSRRLQGASDDEKSALWELACGQLEQFAIVRGSSVDRILSDYARWAPGLRPSDQRAMQGLRSWHFEHGARRRFQAVLEACLVGEAKQALSQNWRLEVLKIALAVAALYALLRAVVVPVLDLASAYLLAPWGLAPLAGGVLHLLVVCTAVILGLSLLIGEEPAYKNRARLSLLEADQAVLALVSSGLIVALDLGIQAGLVWLRFLPIPAFEISQLSQLLTYGLRAILTCATVSLAVGLALEIKARELGVRRAAAA